MSVKGKISKLSVALFSGAALGAAVFANNDSASADEVYTVKSGDTLSELSYTYGLNGDYNKIAQDNNISNPDLILVGQKLIINGSGQATQATEEEVAPLPEVETSKNISTPTEGTQSIQSAQSTVNSAATQSQSSSSTQSSSAASSVAVASSSTVSSRRVVKLAPKTTTKVAPVQRASQPQRAQSSQKTVAPARTQSNNNQNTAKKPAATNNNHQSSSSYTPNASGSEAAAKAWIAARESGGSYTARNGQFYGKYQLTISYLHGDLSPANQERVADSYVHSRYGSWVAAKAAWLSQGWY